MITRVITPLAKNTAQTKEKSTCVIYSSKAGDKTDERTNTALQYER
jgi:hypothetical protein